MKILVTGCYGFIGSNLCAHLLNLGHDVLGFDNMSNCSIDPERRIWKKAGDNCSRFGVCNVDVRDPFAVRERMKNENIEAVVHLAALGSVPRSFKTPQATVSVNEGGFATVLQVMAELGINRLVYASSSSVYGDHPQWRRIEGYEGKPLSPYALSKKMNEEFARLYCPTVQINHVGLRFFNVYGPGQLVSSPYSAVIPKFINTDTPTIYGDGESVRDYTFVDDVCAAIVSAIDYAGNGFHGVFNVGFGTGTSVNQLAQMLEKKAIVREPERKGDVRGSLADTGKARTWLGFRAATPLPLGLEITKEYYKSLQIKEQPAQQATNP